jgi:hypothetical protein
MGRKCCKTNLNHQPTTDRCNISRCQPTALPGKAPESWQNRTDRTAARLPGPPPATGAGEGNRTLVISLEGFCSTIELHPPCTTQDNNNSTSHVLRRQPRYVIQDGGGGWIRTNVGARPTDLQSAPFSRSGTPPAEPEIICVIHYLVKIPCSRKPWTPSGLLTHPWFPRADPGSIVSEFVSHAPWTRYYD